MTEGNEVKENSRGRTIVDECIKGCRSMGVEVFSGENVILVGNKSNLKEIVLNMVYAGGCYEQELQRARSIMARNNGVIPLGPRGALPALREIDRLFSETGREINFDIKFGQGVRKIPRIFSNKINDKAQIEITGGGETNTTYSANDTFYALEEGIFLIRSNPVKLVETQLR